MAVADTTETNRYLNARRNPDFTIDQDWASYSREEHDRWDRLFRRSQAMLRERACDEFLAAMDTLELSEAGIPDMAKLSDRLETNHRLARRAGRRARARRHLLQPSRQPAVSGRRLHPPGIADGLSRGAGHLPRRVRPCAAAGESGVRRFHAGLRQRRAARARARLPEEPGAALLVHGRVRADPQRRGPAHLRRRHHVVDDRKRVRAGRRLAASRRVQSRTRHAHQLHHRRFPADLFRDRQLPVAAGRVLSRLRPDLCVDRHRERHRSRSS